MKARFFLAEACYQTWTKIYVLTEYGLLHSKYLNYMQPHEDNENVDFETFKAEDYSYGGYQTLKEITLNEALNVSLTRQVNWVSAYLRLKQVNL